MSLALNPLLAQGNQHEMFSMFAKLKITKKAITKISSYGKYFHISNI